MRTQRAAQPVCCESVLFGMLIVPLCIHKFPGGATVKKNVDKTSGEVAEVGIPKGILCAN